VNLIALVFTSGEHLFILFETVNDDRIGKIARS